VNAELRGPILAATLQDCDPTVLIADAELSEIVGEQLPDGVRLLVLDELTGRVGSAEPRSWS